MAGKRAEMPHFAYQQISCPTTEKFGLVFPQSVMNTAASLSQLSPSNELPLKLKSSNYDAIKKRILNIRPVEPALVHDCIMESYEAVNLDIIIWVL